MADGMGVSDLVYKEENGETGQTSNVERLDGLFKEHFGQALRLETKEAITVHLSAHKRRWEDKFMRNAADWCNGVTPNFAQHILAVFGYIPTAQELSNLSTEIVQRAAPQIAATPGLAEKVHHAAAKATSIKTNRAWMLFIDGLKIDDMVKKKEEAIAEGKDMLIKMYKVVMVDAQAGKYGAASSEALLKIERMVEDGVHQDQWEEIDAVLGQAMKSCSEKASAWVQGEGKKFLEGVEDEVVKAVAEVCKELELLDEGA